jgi:uncharacterized protein YabE (DUF348 family)
MRIYFCRKIVYNCESMHRRVFRRIIQRNVFVGIIVGCAVFVVLMIHMRASHHFIPADIIGHVMINDDGHMVNLYDISAQTVDDVIKKYDASIDDNDRVFPMRTMRVFDHDVIHIDRAHIVKVLVDGEQKEIRTFKDTLREVFAQNNVAVEKNDIVKPPKDMIVRGDVDATIVRVSLKKEVITKKIAYKTEERKDDTVNFLKRFTEQKGENGMKEIVYEVAYHDGEEVAREIMSENVTKEPVTEMVVQGTKVVVGKKHNGACSWYAHTGTLSAANPWLPIGSYVRVTNQDNGKSVIVRINDRGPFVPGRIIDLDKVAFEEIASLGAGVINVKMEEIIN